MMKKPGIIAEKAFDTPSGTASGILMRRFFLMQVV